MAAPPGRGDDREAGRAPRPPDAGPRAVTYLPGPLPARAAGRRGPAAPVGTGAASPCVGHDRRGRAGVLRSVRDEQRFPRASRRLGTEAIPAPHRGPVLGRGTPGDTV